MMPAQVFKMTQWLKVTTFTCRKIKISNPIVVTDFLDPSKSGARHNYVYFTLPEHN